MLWERKPVYLLLLAGACILVGTIITMVLPFAWVNSEGDRIASVSPYSPLQLAGRDLYIREGCNNCHSQTVRPLEAEVKRYGPYSRSGEFAYDRPFLWGSRRMGPDLARIGAKYPNGWHLRHMRNPESMVAGSNMPSYAFLDSGKVDPELTRKKMSVLGFPFVEADIAGLAGKTEMDAMIAYLQKLGTDLPREKPAPASAPVGRNPFAGDPRAAAEGGEYYAANCAQCHGAQRQGDLAAELRAEAYSDEKIFLTIRDGQPKEGMPPFGHLGSDRIWKLITFINAKVK